MENEDGEWGVGLGTKEMMFEYEFVVFSILPNAWFCVWGAGKSPTRLITSGDLLETALWGVLCWCIISYIYVYSISFINLYVTRLACGFLLCLGTLEVDNLLKGEVSVSSCWTSFPGTSLSSSDTPFCVYVNFLQLFVLFVIRTNTTSQT